MRRGRLRGVPVRALDAVLRWQIRKAGLVNIRGHHVLLSALGPGALVVDAGANRGEFSCGVLALVQCKAIALEPAPYLFAKIPERPGLVKLPRALAAQSGATTLHLSNNPEAHSLEKRQASLEGAAGSLEIQACTLVDLFAEFGRPADLLKLDIEGAEIEVLETAPDSVLCSIGQITVEFHDFQVGHERGPAVLRIMRRLRALGFESLNLCHPFGHHADTLFLNSRRRAAATGRGQRLAMRWCTLPVRRAIERARTRWPGPRLARFP